MNNSIFKTFFLSLCIIANTSFAQAQTASILPPAKTTFLDNNGKPLTSGKVYFYVPSTTTPKTTWQNSSETTANTNPVILDAAGRALIYGDGTYRQIVKDRYDNIIWDAVTSSSGSGGGGSTATGDGDLVGTIKPWAGMTAPNQYAFTYGQEVSRTTYAVLMTAITSSQSIFCNSGSPTLSGLSDTTNFWIGMSVEVSCLAAGFSTVISKTASTITLAASANVTTNTTAIFFPWGRGNGTTTFNLPDFRGLAIAGNNNMGGVSSANLRTVFFGIATPDASGAKGGGDNQVLLTGNLPPHTHTSSTLTDPGHKHTGMNLQVYSTTSNNGGSAPTVPTSSQITETTTASTGITISASTGTNASGLSTAFSIVTPTRTSNYIIKITPDANSTTASGVTSLGSMTGSIACGTGLLCTGNIISSTVAGNVVGPNPSTVNNIAIWDNTSGTLLANSSISSVGGNLNILNDFTSGGGINALNSAASSYKTILSMGTNSVGVDSTRLVSGGGGISYENAARDVMGYWGDANQRLTIGIDDGIGEVGSPLFKVNSNNLVFSGDSVGGQILLFRNTATTCVEDLGTCSYSIYSQAKNDAGSLVNTTILNCGILHREAGNEAGDCDMKIMVAGVMHVPMAWDGSASPPNMRSDQANVWDIGSLGTPYRSLYLGTALSISGSIAGNLTQTVQASTGTPTITWGTSSGTPAVTASSPLAINATTGDITCTTCATTSGSVASFSAGTTGLTPSSATTGAITLAGIVNLSSGGTNANLTASNGGIFYSTATAGAILAGTASASRPLLSGATAAPTWAAVSYPASATSGGVAYFSSTSVMVSSALLSTNALMLGGGAGAAPSTLGSLGTTSTVLHGNAAGAPTFGAVVSADLNITTTTCTNQFVTAISSGAVGTCTTDTLASAQHANQGTTTTVLHGNAAGNPSWGAIVDADFSGQLSLTKGGTNANLTAVNGGAVYSTATAFGITSAGTSGQVLTSNGAGAPTWQNSVHGVSGSACGVTATAGADTFYGTCGNATSYINVALVVPYSGTLKNLYVTPGAAAGAGQTFTAVMQVAGVDVSVGTTGCTAFGGAGYATCSDTTNTVAVTAGSTVNLRVHPSAGAAATVFAWGAQITIP